MFGKNIQWKQALRLYYCTLRSSQGSSGNSVDGQALSAKPGAVAARAAAGLPMRFNAGSDFKARSALPGAGGGRCGRAMLAALGGLFPGKEKPGAMAGLGGGGADLSGEGDSRQPRPRLANVGGASVAVLADINPPPAPLPPHHVARGDAVAVTAGGIG